MHTCRFFFNDTATTEIYTLSLHDALPIYDTAVVLMVLGLARFLATGEEPVAGETLLTGVFPFYNLYETQDGRWLAVATVEPKFWTRMCELVGAPDLADQQFTEGE